MKVENLKTESGQGEEDNEVPGPSSAITNEVFRTVAIKVELGWFAGMVDNSDIPTEVTGPVTRPANYYNENEEEQSSSTRIKSEDASSPVVKNDPDNPEEHGGGHRNSSRMGNPNVTPVAERGPRVSIDDNNEEQTEESIEPEISTSNAASITPIPKMKTERMSGSNEEINTDTLCQNASFEATEPVAQIAKFEPSNNESSLCEEEDESNPSRPRLIGIQRVKVEVRGEESIDNEISLNDNQTEQEEETETPQEPTIFQNSVINNEPTVGVSLNPPYSAAWSHRALGKSKNIVQILLNRQLGLPFYSRSGDAVCNGFNEMDIAKQIISTRAPKDEGKKSTAKEVKLKKRSNSINQENNATAHRQSGWMQLYAKKPDKTKISIVDTHVWSRIEIEKDVFLEEFYSFEPSSTIIRMSKLRSTGKLTKVVVLEGRGLNTKSKTSTYLLTLTEPNYLRAYDMNKRKVSDELRLSMDFVPNLKGYTSLEVLEREAKLFVMGAEGPNEKNVRVILILDFPPSWTKVGVIYIDIPMMKLSFDGGLCFILQKSNQPLELSTWPFLKEKLQVSSPTGKTPASTLAVKFEGHLREMPITINKITFAEDYFGLLETEVPLLYVRNKAGLALFPVVNTGNTPGSPIYQFSYPAKDKKDPLEIFPLAGEMTRTLVTAHMSNKYEVATLSFKRDSSGMKTVETEVISQPFNYWDEVEARLRAESITAASRSTRTSRPRRACAQVTNSLMPVEKKSILGIQHSQLLNLFAVLTADEEDILMVLYKDSCNFPVFKALPPLYIWPPMRDGNPNKKRDSITTVDIAFEPQFIFIYFEYEKNCHPSQEFYSIPLMLENNVD